MRIELLPRLACPACLPAGETARFDLDPIRSGGGEDGGTSGDVIEAYLVCRRCRGAWPLVAGIPVLSRDVAAHLATHGNVYRRTPIADPRLTRFVLGLARGGSDVVPFEEVVARYGDLLPEDPKTLRSKHPGDEALNLALQLVELLGERGPALEVGCGVGRGTFVLAGRLGEAIGADRSVARVRRARNVLTAETFHLPTHVGARLETPIDLSRLSRERVDFVVADPGALPFARGACPTVVVRASDGEGPLADREDVRREARRVAGATGVVLVERADSSGGEPTFEFEQGEGSVR